METRGTGGLSADKPFPSTRAPSDRPRMSPFHGLCEIRCAGQRLTGVDVELPATLHTHSRRQSFHFDDEGLLRRHDDVADIVGWMARGAHLWRNFVAVGGIPIPRERHVVLRLAARPHRSWRCTPRWSSRRRLRDRAALLRELHQGAAVGVQPVDVGRVDGDGHRAQLPGREGRDRTSGDPPECPFSRQVW